MPPEPSQLLTPPTLAINVREIPISLTQAADGIQYPHPYTRAGGHSRRPSESSQHSLQSPISATSPSLDGATLATQRSRASSFKSHVESTRTRGYSDVGTLQTGYDGDHLSNDEALRPDVHGDPTFIVDRNPFAFSPGQLNKLLGPKSIPAFKALGGVRGLERGLRADVQAGLSSSETTQSGSISFDSATSRKATEDGLKQATESSNLAAEEHNKDLYIDRMRVFGNNRIPKKPPVTIWKLFWNAYNDRILFLLTGAAVISLALGIYEAVDAGGVDWVEGVAIIVAILIVVLATGINDFRKDRQFLRLNARKEDRFVRSIRSGEMRMIPIHEVMVGDLLHLESGDAAPADGILVTGHSVECDESSYSGESDAVKKTTGGELWRHLNANTATNEMDPFIISGTKVLDGVGQYLVTSVGVNSTHGKIMMSLQHEDEQTPLQAKLNKLANWIGYLGTAAAVLLFTVSLARFLATLSTNVRTPAQKGSQFLDILIVAVTIIVVAVPEGLPLSVTLALSFATKSLYEENNLVRRLRACETMGNATTICSDKTGTLTQNKMTVVAGTLGSSASFSNSAQPSMATADAAFNTISDDFRALLLQSTVINSTGFEVNEGGKIGFAGSKTETALLDLAKKRLGLQSLAQERGNTDVVQIFPFNSRRKCMGVVLQRADGSFRMLVKGAAEVMLERASRVTIPYGDSEKPSIEDFTVETRERLSRTIDDYGTQSLRTLGLLYRDFCEWPPKCVKAKPVQAEVQFEDVFDDMIFIGLMGIRDPIREGVPYAVHQCQMAGIKVRMVTGDNVKTATAIATDCGIRTPDGIVLEGAEFRRLSDVELERVLPNLEVLARSTPEDKRVLVNRLKRLGETVAVTGDGTNDAAALKEADIGFSMGITGTEVAKEASSIILMDDNFRSIVKAIMWGRSVNDAVAKFLQFQLTVNITAVVLAFVSAVYSPEFKSVLSAVQLLWVNLIMDTFAALALATDKPTEAILQRPPVPKRAKLITTNMWKMIVGQSIYQLAITFTLYFAGARILNYNVELRSLNRNEDQQIQLDTIVFNAFVWMQVFNEFNNRRLDNHFNIFEGILQNYYFIGINCIMVAGQILIIFVGGLAFQIVPLDGAQWAISVLCAVPCLIWAVVLRCIPDEYVATLIHVIGALYQRTIGSAFSSCARFFSKIFAPLASIRSRGGRAFQRRTRPSTTMHTAGTDRIDLESAISPGLHNPASPSGPLSPPPITLTRMD